jgi:glycerol-3-phosphate acyltransferase PlsY
MIILTSILGYLIGSFSSSYFTDRLVKGNDISAMGSRNAGGHRIMLVVGRGWGSLVAALDIGKGALAAWLGREPGGGLAVGVLSRLAAC